MLGPIIGFLVGNLAAPLMQSSLRPLWNKINQEVSEQFPNEILPPQNLIGMRWRGLIDDDRYKTELAKQGIDSERAGLLYTASETLYQAYDVVSMYRRAIIDEEQMKTELTILGYTDERQEKLLKVTEMIPSAQDVIRFAVREVYTPEIAERFGQFEGADRVLESAKTDIAATGITEDAFRKFWAAHWELPSINQGFEMMHRGVIGDAEIDMLMEALDVMPWWRSNLKSISYNPYTRVDVRRMHKLGILSDDALVRSYKDLGYDQEHAEGMASFTIEYNRIPEAAESTAEDEEKARVKEATRASIMKAYHNNIIDVATTREYLASLDYTPEATELYIAIEDFAREDEITDDSIATAHEAYTRNIWTHTQVIDTLGKLNLPGRQIDTLIAKWDMEKAARPSKPTKAELFSFYRGKIITIERLKEELTAYGYSDQYITWYIAAEKKKGG